MKLSRWAVAGMGLLTLAVPSGASANSGPDPALGSGLGRLVNQGQATAFKTRGFRFVPDRLAIRDSQGRVLVDLTAAEGTDLATLRTAAVAQGMTVTATDAARGTIEGFIGLDKVSALQGLQHGGSLVLAARGEAHAGSVQSQGVPFQRIDAAQSLGANGSGITVAAQSDSFDTATLTALGDPLKIHAAQDVKSGDLPGPGNPDNSQPVVVLNDDTTGAGEDEGRGMLQIVHDVAPKAKLCFGTADLGLLTFTQNVLDLADKSGPCGADVLVDDITFFNEPMFSDSALTDAIDKVTAQGAHYFSSVGNEGSRQGWAAPLRLLDARTQARAAHLNLDGVDPALYSGGFQDMDPGPGTDVAQSVQITGGSLHGADGIFDLQWNDPFDPNGTQIGAPILSGSGNLTAANPQFPIPFDVSASQVGKQFQAFVDGVPSGSTDIVLTLVDPAGNVLTQVDTGTSPEQLSFTPTQTGRYQIVVSGYQGATGPFTYQVSPILAPSKVTTDLNLLFFDTDGNFLGAQADDNTLTGQPTELTALAGLDDFQVVIARTGTGPTPVTQLRDVLFDGAQFQEYSDPTSVSTFGHTEARGTVAVGAYDPFPPFLREGFTSAGGDLPVYFDSSANRYPAPSIRRVPSISATDGGNTTFFVSDNVRDTDDRPNFFGTSASAPHAAGIAALVLQKNGGGTSLSSAALRQRLESSTFAHDLDPNYAAGVSSGLTISAAGIEGRESDINRGPFYAPDQFNPRFFTLSYNGSVPLKSVEFFGGSANPTGYQGPGIAFDPRPFGGESPFDDDGFPFTVGGTTGGLKASDVAATFQEPAGNGEFKKMTLTFKDGALRGNRGLSFGVDRDELHTALGYPAEGDSADILGGAVSYPSGQILAAGMRFRGTRTDGTQFTGVMTNNLGYGYNPVDGYGVINAQKAVSGDAARKRRRR